MRTPEEFLNELLELLGREAITIASRAAPSRTIRQSMFLRRVASGIRVVVPHYWAVYYHDGRGPISASRAQYLIFYKNPQLDPRIRRGYPVRATGIVKLSAQQFRRDAALGRLVIRKMVGPTTSATSHPFFSQGLAGFDIPAGRIVRTEFSKWVREMLGTDRQQRQTARGRIT